MHHVKNFGSQFALWDWVFGTLYIPQRQERLRFGIDPQDSRRLRTVADLYLQPFRDAKRHLESAGRWPLRLAIRNLPGRA